MLLITGNIQTYTYPRPHTLSKSDQTNLKRTLNQRQFWTCIFRMHANSSHYYCIYTPAEEGSSLPVDACKYTRLFGNLVQRIILYMYVCMGVNDMHDLYGHQ